MRTTRKQAAPLIFTQRVCQKRTLSCLGILTISVVLMAGCALGPKYAYTVQRDSAVVSVAPSGNAQVYIEHIDGFAAPLGMQYKFSSGTYELPLSPSRHSIEVLVDSTWSVPEGLGNVEQSAGKNITIVYNFVENGRYHLTAGYKTPTFYLALWEDDSGSSVKVGTWRFGY